MTAFDSKGLDSLRHLEQELLLTQVNGDLFWLEEVKDQERNPTFYSLDPSIYIIRAYAPLETRMAAYTRFANAVPTAVEQIKHNLQPPLARPFIDIGQTVFGGFATYFQNDVPAAFSDVSDSVLQENFRTANIRAIRAMNDLMAWLERQKSTATDSFALGPKLFSEMLRVSEHVDIPLPELEKIGRQDLERNLAALREECARYAPGKSVQDCIDREQANKPAGNLLVAAQKQLVELKKFVTSQKLAAIPGTEDVLVKESPPYRRWNMASISIPGPFEKGLPSRYYITLPDHPGLTRLVSTTCRGKLRCSSLRCMRCGRDIFCSSFMRVSVHPLRKDLRLLRFWRGVGTLHGGDDVGCGPAKGRSGSAHWPAQRGIAS